MLEEQQMLYTHQLAQMMTMLAVMLDELRGYVGQGCVEAGRGGQIH